LTDESGLQRIARLPTGTDRDRAWLSQTGQTYRPHSPPPRIGLKSKN